MRKKDSLARFCQNPLNAYLVFECLRLHSRIDALEAAAVANGQNIATLNKRLGSKTKFTKLKLFKGIDEMAKRFLQKRLEDLEAIDSEAAAAVDRLRKKKDFPREFFP